MLRKLAGASARGFHLLLLCVTCALGGTGVARAAGPVNSYLPLSIPVPEANEEIHFGSSVGISGDLVAIGFDTGEFDYLRATNGGFFNPHDGGGSLAPGSVAVSVQGSREIVGETVRTNPGGIATGAAFVVDGEGSPSQQSRSLYPSDGHSGDAFGGAVALDGNRLVVADSVADPARGFGGEVYVFDLVGGQWLETARIRADSATGFTRDNGFGTRVAVSGDRILVGAPVAAVAGRSSAGAVYVFTLLAGTWQQTAILTGGIQSQFFGYSVALDGSRALVGTGAIGGAVYFFDLAGGNWQQTASFAGFGDQLFGYSVALQGTRALVGSVQGAVCGPGPGCPPPDIAPGYAQLIELQGNGWQETTRIGADFLSNFGYTPSTLFGSSVALNHNEIVVGDPGASHTNSSGSVKSGAALWLAFDDCPDDPNKLTPGICGCGAPETSGCAIQMLGADALKTSGGLSSFVCPDAVGINYLGGGSVLGEKALITSVSQHVSPMSRFLEGGACGAANPSKAEGIAFAADGLSILASGVHRAACDPMSNASQSASCNGASPSGLRSSGSIGSYALGANNTGWRDVLRELFLGLPNTAGKNPDGSTPAGRALRDCNSTVRQTLVNNWGNLFENACSGSGGSCTRLNHIFRPDSFSGAADVLRELIDAKLFPFCNQRFAGDTTPVDYPTTRTDGSPIFDDVYQDFDPIRRHCDGDGGGGADLPNPITSGGVTTQPDYPLFTAEQVCSPKNTLGLVLVVEPPAINNSPAVADLYPIKPCQKGKLAFAPAPVLPGTTQSTLCPNGDVTVGNTVSQYHMDTGVIDNSSHNCIVPVAADGDFRCINGHNNFVTPVAPPFGAIPPALRDGRVYNLHLRKQGSGGYQNDTRLGTLHNVVGDFSRIHATRTLLAAAPTCVHAGSDGMCCDQLDATEQIGCLTEADSCSLGLAAGAARNVQLRTSGAQQTAFGASIDDIQNTQSCVVSEAYPLSRKMYLNTTIGFENITGPELGLAKCLANASASQLAAFGLYPLPTGPVCQDFAQEACPGGAPASDACANNPLGIPTVNRCVAASIDDGNSCTNDSCDPSCALGACAGSGATHGPVTDGTACTLNDPCKNPGTCSAGTCSATDIALTNTNPCITETCSPLVGVVRNPITGTIAGGTCNAGVFTPTGSVVLTEPGLDNTVPPTSASLFAALAGPPNQTGAVTSLDPTREAHLFGTVTDAATGAPLPGVVVLVASHTEWGQTLTRADGKFDLIANGGGQLVVRFSKSGGYLPVDRQAAPIWGGGAHIDDVAMVKVDAIASAVALNSAAFHDAVGSTTTAAQDARGARQARIIVPPSTTATAVDVDGTTHVLDSSMTVHATEFTIGNSSQALARMPAPLPGSSLYTYAVDFSIDEFPNTGSVAFNHPVFSYVDNFLQFPTGVTIPDGYYDRSKAAWVPEDNGLVIAIIGYSAGSAIIDVTGDNQETAADTVVWSALPANEQITAGERTLLATRYPGATSSAPKSLWRVPLKHFSMHDFNLGGGVDCVGTGSARKCPAFDGQMSGADAPQAGTCKRIGSIIGAEDQSLGESLPVMGTPYSLEYRSSYTLGYLPARGVEVDFSQAQDMPNLKERQVVLETPGGAWNVIRPATYANFVSWDGRDSAGRRVNGSQLATILANVVYAGSYKATGGFGDSAENDTVTAGYSMVAGSAPDVYFTRTFTKVLSAWGSDVLGLGGWTLSPMHVYDPTSGVLYQGDGRQRNLHSELAIRWIAGNGTATNSGSGTAIGTNTGISASDTPSLAVASNGDVYFASVGSSGTSILRRIDALTRNVFDVLDFGRDSSNAPYSVGRMAFGPTGQYLFVPASKQILRVDVVAKTLQIFGGTGVASHADGPASIATFTDAAAVASAADGTLYVTDGKVVRKVATDDAHTVSTVAGATSATSTPYRCDSADLNLNADGKEAKKVQLSLFGITATAPAVAADGSLWIGTGLDLIRVDPQGLAHCYKPQQPIFGGLAIGSDQSVYFAVDDGGGEAAPNKFSIQRLMPDGTTATVAGGLGCGDPKPLDGARGANSQVCRIHAMAPGPDGSIYFVNTSDNVAARIFELAMPVKAGPAACPVALPSEDGAQTFCFDTNGRHFSTRDTVTGATLLTFTYTNSLLSQIQDADGNITRITQGNPVVINGPFGQTTKIGLDPVTKYATYIEDATQQQTLLSHDANGLLLSMTDRNSNQHTFSYDDLGRLKRDADPANGYQILNRTLPPNGGYSVSDVTAMGATSSYGVSVSPQGVETRTVSLPDGSQNQSTLDMSGGTTTTFADGSSVTEATAPDALWPSYLPYVSSSTTLLPSGLSRTLSTSRLLNFQAGSNPPAIDTVVEQATNTSLPGNPTLTRSFKSGTQTYKVTTPVGRFGTTAVDTFGRPLTVSPFGSVNLDGSAIPGGIDPISYTYDHGRLSSISQGSRLATLEYYPVGGATPGQLKKISMPGLTTVLIPDDAGRALSSTTGSSHPVETDFSWDGEGNLSTVTPPGQPFHAQTYTPVNLLESYVPPPVPELADATTSFFYNADHSLEYVRQPGARGIQYVYNTSKGQLVQIIAGGAADASLAYYTLSDHAGSANGRLHTAARGATTVSLRYDGPLTTSQSWSGTGPDAVNGSAAWGYDADFRVQTETVSPPPTAPGLDTARFVYDSDGLLTCASLSASSSSCTAGPSTMTLVPSPSSGALASTRLGVVTESYTRNEYGELASYVAKKTDGTILYSVVYDDGVQIRDGIGRVSHQVESVSSTTTSYLYDQQGRLQRSGNVNTITYGYDPNGNRTTINSILIGSYDAQDRMLTYNGALYEYGPNGERRKRTNPDSSVDQYEYDALGNLSHVTRNDGVAIDYAVDAFNRRIAKKKNGSTSARYIYRNGLSPVAVLDSSGALAARFVYASHPNTPDFMVLANGAVYKFINDQRGSPRVIVNTATGAVAQRIDYDDFGVQTMVTNSNAFPTWAQPFGFAGGLYDEDTGLERFGARDYEAQTGRWLAKDPILFRGNQANLYVYNGNDPVNALDPSGLLGDSVGYVFSGGSPWLPAFGTLFGMTLPSGASFSVGIFKNFDFSSGDLTFGLYRTKAKTVDVSKAPLFCSLGGEASINLTNDFSGKSVGGGVDLGEVAASASFSPGSYIPSSLNANIGVGGGAYVGGYASETNVLGISVGLSGIHFVDK